MEENRLQAVFAIDCDSVSPDSVTVISDCVLKVLSCLSQSLPASSDTTPFVEFGYLFFRSRHWKTHLKRREFFEFNLKIFKRFEEDFAAKCETDKDLPRSTSSLSAVYQILLKEIGHDFPWRKSDESRREISVPKRLAGGCGGGSGGGGRKTADTQYVHNFLFLVGDAPSTKEQLQDFMGAAAETSSYQLAQSFFRSLFPPLVASLYKDQIGCAVSWIHSVPTSIAPNFANIFPLVGGSIIRSTSLKTQGFSVLAEALRGKKWQSWEGFLVLGNVRAKVELQSVSTEDCYKSTKFVSKGLLTGSAFDLSALDCSRSLLCVSNSDDFLSLIATLKEKGAALLLEYDDYLGLLCPVKSSALIFPTRKRPTLQDDLSRSVAFESSAINLPSTLSRLRERLNDVSKPRTFLPLTPAQLAAKKRMFKGIDESRRSLNRSMHRRASSGIDRSLLLLEEGRRKSKEGDEFAKARNNSFTAGAGSPSSSQALSPAKEAKQKREALRLRRMRLYNCSETETIETIGINDEESLLIVMRSTYDVFLEEASPETWQTFDVDACNKMLCTIQALFNGSSRFFKFLSGSASSDTATLGFVERNFIKSKTDLRTKYAGKFDDVNLAKKSREFEAQVVLRLESESLYPSTKNRIDLAEEIVDFLRNRDPNYLKHLLNEFLLTNFLHLSPRLLIAVHELLFQPLPDILVVLTEEEDEPKAPADSDSDDELSSRLKQWQDNDLLAYDSNPSISALLSLQGSVAGSYVSNTSNLSQGSSKTTFTRHSSMQQSSQRQIVVPAQKKGDKKRKPSRVEKRTPSKSLSQSCIIERTASALCPDSATKKVRRNLFEDQNAVVSSSKRILPSPGTHGSGRKGKRLNRTFTEGQTIPQTPPKANQRVLKDRTVTETPNHKQMPMNERLTILRRRMIERDGATQEEAQNFLAEMVIVESPIKSRSTADTPPNDSVCRLKLKTTVPGDQVDKVEKDSPATRASSLVRRRSFYTHDSDKNSRNFDKYLQSRDLADRIGGRKRRLFEGPLATSSRGAGNGDDSDRSLSRSLFDSESPVSSSRRLFADSTTLSLGTSNATTSLEDDVFESSKELKNISSKSLEKLLGVKEISSFTDENGFRTRSTEKTADNTDAGFDKWRRIKPRFGLHPSKTNSVVNSLFDDSSPVKASRKRELSPPGSPDLFMTPTKRAKVESRSNLASPPSKALRLNNLWGTDRSPSTFSPKPSVNAPLKSPPVGGDFLSPAKRVVGTMSPVMFSPIKTPTKSPSIASILHLVTSPMKSKHL